MSETRVVVGNLVDALQADANRAADIEEARSQLGAVPKRRMPAAMITALVGAVALSGVGVPDPFTRRKKITDDNAWRISDTDFAAERIAKAEAKRKRKAERRRGGR